MFAVSNGNGCAIELNDANGVNECSPALQEENKKNSQEAARALGKENVKLGQKG